MTDDFDELDRALFALPLEVPPPRLHQAILRSTVYAPPRPVGEPIRLWECVFAGTALAVGVWLIVALVAIKGFAAAFNADVIAFERVFTEPNVLMWFGAGGAAAAWLTYLTSVGLRLPLRGARS
jgi:hypothetical protein